ncbi:MAG: class I SAM-dependent methyltransferase [Parvibaculum sp.]|nr:class I SAM-dependent methyltransferase [Parvibaculum sp.]
MYVENSPALEEINAAHKQGLHRGETTLDSTGKRSEWKVKYYSGILENIYGPTLDKKIAWLDVGCGHGEFLEALRAFWPDLQTLVGSEPNVRKQESAKSRGLDVEFIDLSAEKRKFDVVSFLNVYSHLPNPRIFLDEVRSVLNPGGEILLQTGDVAHLEKQDMFRPYSLPDHLSFANESLVRELLRQQGFEVISVHKFPVTPTDPVTVVKEVIKHVIPGYTSSLARVRLVRRIGNTDMYVRARREGK